ncbi:MAG: RES family NAD+ phosphorylase [Candidatus Velthaea sp.]
MWRITRAKYAHPAIRAYDGHGAARSGQRWNEKGVRAAYASATLSLAALEYLGTVGEFNDAPNDLVAVPADVRDDSIESVDVATVPDWSATPPAASVRFGTTWIVQRRSVALRVPSVMIACDVNYVLNPKHPDFSSAVFIRVAEPFTFDQRLIRRSYISGTGSPSIFERANTYGTEPRASSSSLKRRSL